MASLLGGFAYLGLLLSAKAGANWAAGVELTFWGSSPADIWFTSAIIYFAWVLPIAILLVLLPARRHPNSNSTSETPAMPDWASRGLAAVLTAYNDEESIGPAVDEFVRLPRINKVIVVDNNCTDRTDAVASAHGAEVVPEPRQGYGFACMRGLRFALERTDAELVVLVEGDMTFFGDDVPKLLPYLEECDMVLGTRTNRTLTREGSQMDWFLAWGNLALAFLIRLRYWDRDFLGQVQLTDVGCTFRVIRRSALERIIDQLKVGGDYFSPHMILVALRNELRLVEAPIKFRARVGLSKGAGHSRRRALRIGFSMVHEITFH